VAAHTTSYVGEDGVAIVKFDGERRARINLFDIAGHLDRAFLDVLSVLGLGLAWPGFSDVVACGY
jgi:hypothetical protein